MVSRPSKMPLTTQAGKKEKPDACPLRLCCVAVLKKFPLCRQICSAGETAGRSGWEKSLHPLPFQDWGRYGDEHDL